MSATRNLLDGYLTVHEAADQLHRTRQTIYALMQRGLPWVKISGSRLIPIEEAKAWIAVQRVDRSPRRQGRPLRSAAQGVAPARAHDSGAAPAPPSSTRSEPRIQRTRWRVS